ncbi:glycosyltransferase [Brumimicrobium salinarum]|uniref:Glycosyltransferase n=1 Tax=Brumimicrobium salinarum TaxID=2058658 RepID=A0A2I0R4W3_9FLAO|nr:glycosyltransferase [Brumimicrobium salinarum]PKR81615.1 glycosyltransferase [Brumimicrobium salinarum]
MHSSKTYKKLVVITSRFPFPLEKGDKLRAYHQIKELAHHFEIHLISTSEINVGEKWKSQLKPYCKTITVYPINGFQKITGLLRQLLSKKPFQVGYFYHLSIQQKINKQLRRIQPDHIYCQLIRSAEYVKNYHDCPKTIDYMDAFSKGMERRANTANWIYKLIFQSEHKRLTNYENSIFEYFEHHTIISKQDKNYIFHTLKEQIHIVPNGVDESFLVSPSPSKQEFDLVFTGNMSYPPNITAVQFIVEEVLPLLPKNIKLKIAGASPSSEVLKLASDQVHITGFVEDIRTAYQSAKIFIAPMFLGTGLQNKLLEAMALGIPCITTSLANNALDAQPNHEILIADEAQTFAHQIQRLLAEPKLSQQLIEQGRSFISAKYKWNKVTQTLVDLIKN